MYLDSHQSNSRNQHYFFNIRRCQLYKLYCASSENRVYRRAYIISALTALLGPCRRVKSKGEIPHHTKTPTMKGSLHRQSSFSRRKKWPHIGMKNISLQLYCIFVVQPSKLLCLYNLRHCAPSLLSDIKLHYQNTSFEQQCGKIYETTLLESSIFIGILISSFLQVRYINSNLRHYA